LSEHRFKDFRLIPIENKIQRHALQAGLSFTIDAFQGSLRQFESLSHNIFRHILADPNKAQRLKIKQVNSTRVQHALMEVVNLCKLEPLGEMTLAASLRLI